MEETNISQILKACRQKAGLTQAQFAETIGVKRSAYAYYESGRTSAVSSSGSPFPRI